MGYLPKQPPQLLQNLGREVFPDKNMLANAVICL